jgi:guanine deaminase
MIVAGQLLLDDSAGCCRLAPGFVRLDGEVIAEVVEGEIPQAADGGGPDALITPGFIDAHLHLPQFDMIGSHGLPLLRWLSEYTFPAESKWESVDFARAMTARVADQLLSVGTTGVCAYATVHHDSAVAGLRGVIGQVLMNRYAPPQLCRETNQLIDEAAKLGELYTADARMSAAVTPRFALSCSQDLLAAAGKLASQQGAMIQSHVAETPDECRAISELFAGQSYVEVYEQAGLLRERSIYGHGIYLDQNARRTLSENGAAIAHCPTANSFLRSGTMNRSELISDQVRIAIGSDIGAGYERSMVRVARAMIEAAASIGNDFPDAKQAWYAITAGNADTLQWPDAGRLRRGNAADLLVIQPTIPWLAGPADPLALLMFAWDDRWVAKTIVRGEVRSPSSSTRRTM